MIQHNDLYRYHHPDNAQFDDNQVNQIVISADLHLVQRGFPGFFILPILYFTVGYISNFATDHCTYFFSGAAIMTIACLFAIYAGIKLKSPTLQPRIIWQKCYYLTTLTTGLCWGVLASSFLYFYNTSWEMALVLYITAGIAGGSVSSASNWMNLNRLYLAVLFGPILIVSFFFPENSLIIVGVLSLIGFVYNFGQIELNNRIYWDSLANTYLLKNEITAHQKSQTILQQERDAFMRGPVMLFTWKHCENLRVKHVSENVSEILGYTAEEFLDGSVLYADLVHQDDLNRVTNELENSFDEDEGFYTHKPYRLKTRTGGIVWVLDSTTLIRNNQNKITHYNGYLIDITATVNMEGEIVEAKNRLHAISENIPGVIFQFKVSNTGEMGINYASQKLFDIFALEFVDDPLLNYQTFAQNIHDDDKQPWTDSVHTAIEKLIPWQWKGRYVKPLGEVIWFEGHATPTIENDELIFDGILMDITSVKTLEDEKNKTELQLHRAQKMEAIGMMAGGVAHDLNNILSGIVSYPELLLLQLPEESELREPIKAIQESGNRAATVVADLLTVARGAASVREPHDINTLIHDYLTSPECTKLKSLHPAITCSEQLDAKHPLISCSPMHIKKTVMNLMTNAMEACGNNGEVIVSTCNRQVATSGSLEPDVKPGNYVVLTVQDNGSGIPKENIEHIFEPFYTKKVMGRSGTGLGLAVVWNTVQDHNGKIFVKSDDKGTHFTLYFQESKGQETTQADDDTVEKLSGNNESILVVDDEPLLRNIATELLKILGYRVESVDSGEQAIQYAKEHPVDLLVIDMLMEPGINGCQTYKEILKLYPDQKAIVASGFSESDVVKETLRLGAGGFIKKPYSMTQLGRVVKGVLKSTKE